MTYNQALGWLEPARWQRLTNTERTNALQAVENEMAQRSGRTPCNVTTAAFPNDAPERVTAGCYHHPSRTITLNTRLMDDLPETLDTVLHEGRHSYQHAAVEGQVIHPNAQEVLTWRDEQAGYIPPELNPERYYNQACEQDARAFAQGQAEQIAYEREQQMNQGAQQAYHAKRQQLPGLML